MKYTQMIPVILLSGLQLNNKEVHQQRLYQVHPHLQRNYKHQIIKHRSIQKMHEVYFPEELPRCQPNSSKI